MPLHQAYIGLGSNLSGPVEQVTLALSLLDSIPNTRVIKSSQLYGSKPQGPQDQPDFVNAVSLIETTLAPLELLDQLQQIEEQQGRIKKRHWGERVIDLDLILYDDQEIESERLSVPHKQMKNRDFVLVPLYEISPGLFIPGLGSLNQLLSQLKTTFVKPWQCK